MYTGYIYLLTNVQNGKQYVGQTTQNIEYYHIKQLRDARTSRQSRALNSAVKKYGVDNFQRTILEIIKTDSQKDFKELLNTKEIYYIKKYNTYKDGYNMTLGGSNGNIGYHHTKETKEQLSILSKNQKNRNIQSMQIKNQQTGVHNKIKFSEQEIASIIEYRFQLMTTEQIGRIFNCVKSPIINILNKYNINGISLGNSKFISYYKKIKYAESVYQKYYKENYTIQKIRNEFSLSYKIIKWLIKDYKNGICTDN